ncbi:MAG: YceI family protein [Pseudomonadales bacterium]|nr:YceI family protein [Pseudomonadales bacterium]MDP6469791.1 YceI family protein [Pseudomonadales bacterium]MDP6827606.1 YceI family protein [Pseudomonadales bacterium]
MKTRTAAMFVLCLGSTALAEPTAIDIPGMYANVQFRVKHLRSDKYLDADGCPEARLVSTRIEPAGEGTARVVGNLTLHGITREVVIEANHVGAGDDPWGGFRRGFHGAAKLRPGDYGIDISVLGPDSQVVELDLSVEGVRQ